MTENVIDLGKVAGFLAFGLLISVATSALGYFFAFCCWEIMELYRDDPDDEDMKL